MSRPGKINSLAHSLKTEREVMTKVLRAYKENACTWDNCHPDYNNRERKKEANEKLLKIYKALEPDAEMPELRKKLDNMRSSGKRYFKRKLEAKSKGESFYCSLWYYNLIKFLYRDTDEDTCIFTTMPQGEDEKERKRLAERRRMENIRNDPDKYALWKLKQKEIYLKRKREGKVVSVQNMTPKQQKLARKKSRERSRKWYAKKKLKESDIHSEEEIIDECDAADKSNGNDPLDLKLSPSPEVSITPKSTETPSSSQVDDYADELPKKELSSDGNESDSVQFIDDKFEANSSTSFVADSAVASPSGSSNDRREIKSEFSIGEETNLFGTAIDQQLAEVPTEQKNIAEQLIMQIVYLAKMNKLTADTNISLKSFDSN